MSPFGLFSFNFREKYIAYSERWVSSVGRASVKNNKLKRQVRVLCIVFHYLFFLKGSITMKEKIKKVWSEHKTEIIIGAIVVGGVVTIIASGKWKLINSKNLVDYTGKKVISWKPGNGVVNLEEVKEILEANMTTSTPFAIFREGPNPADFVYITF